MSDILRCPFCQQELEVMVGLSNAVLGCSKCKHIATTGIWEELIRTRKALEKAKWWLHEIVESHRCTPISTAEMALKEITALEQKE